MNSTRRAIASIALACFCLAVASHSESAELAKIPATVTATNSPTTNSPSQPLTPEQAKAAYGRKHEPEPGQGTWQYVTISSSPFDTTSRTNYVYITTNNQRFERIEEIVRFKNKGDSVRMFLRIKNSEGSWALHDKIAILTPVENSSSKAAEKDDDLNSDKEFEALAVFSGERFTQDGRVLLRTVGELSAEARRKAVDLLIKRLKKEKEMPFYARMLISTMKGKIADVLPARFEDVMEEQSGALLSERLYDKDGQLTSEDIYWQRCPDLAPDKFLVPENLERIRPKTAKEAHKLEGKIRDQEAKSVK